MGYTTGSFFLFPHHSGTTFGPIVHCTFSEQEERNGLYSSSNLQNLHKRWTLMFYPWYACYSCCSYDFWRYTLDWTSGDFMIGSSIEMFSANAGLESRHAATLCKWLFPSKEEYKIFLISISSCKLEQTFCIHTLARWELGFASFSSRNSPRMRYKDNLFGGELRAGSNTWVGVVISSVINASKWFHFV